MNWREIAAITSGWVVVCLFAGWALAIAADAIK